MAPSNQRSLVKRAADSREAPAKNTRAASHHQQSSAPETRPSLLAPKAKAGAAVLPPHNLRQGAARGTRSTANQEIVSAFEWEALTLEKAKDSVTPPAKAKRKAQPKKQAKALVSEVPKVPKFPEFPEELEEPEQSSAMSRNRPRGPPMPRDNGLAANEETDMWNKILQDLRKAKEKNDKQKVISEQIHALNEKIGKDGGSK